MPELPEVESLRLGLEKVLINNVIKEVSITNNKIVYSNSNYRLADKLKAKEFVDGTKNKKILSISRSAKNLIITLHDESVIIIHLKMTGQLVYQKTLSTSSPSPSGRGLGSRENEIRNNIITGGHPIEESYKQSLPHKHTHIIFTLNDGHLYYNDVRQFGYVLYFKNIDEAKKIYQKEKLGFEPFATEFTYIYLKDKLKNINRSIKQVLLEQKVVVGCGNIYADEICFATKILPMRRCNTLNDEDVKLLYKNIKKILSDAIASGGSSISDYLLADGTRGNYARNHKVYGRSSLPCSVCDTPLSKTIISGRATVFCSNCQK